MPTAASEPPLYSEKNERSYARTAKLVRCTLRRAVVPRLVQPDRAFLPGISLYNLFDRRVRHRHRFIFVLVGIPLLLFMLATTRTLAKLDRQVMGALLDTPTPEMVEDIDPRGANLGERIGMYMGSKTTWRSALYLFAKFLIGLLSITAAFVILPLLAIEVLILAPLTIDMRLISVRLLHWTAIGLHKGSGVLLPTSKKRKRDTSRLETVETAEPTYTIDDDGEIMVQKHFS